MIKYCDRVSHALQRVLKSHVRILEGYFACGARKNSMPSTHPSTLTNSQEHGLSCAKLFSGLF